MSETHLTIGQLAAVTGLSRRTIDFYSREGLLAFTRSDGGHRLYPHDSVARMRAIAGYKESRLRLDEIRARLDGSTDAPTEQAAAIEAELGRLSAEVERLGANEGGVAPEVRAIAARSASKALAVAQALMVLIASDTPFT